MMGTASTRPPIEEGATAFTSDVYNPWGGCYLDGMRLLACLLLVLALAVPARALDDEEAGDPDPGDAGERLRAIDEGNARDADHPEAAGEEVEAPDEHDAIDPDLPPRDPYDDGETEATPPARATRTPPAKPPRYPNVLESAAPTGQAAGGKPTDGKGKAPKAPSPVDADD